MMACRCQKSRERVLFQFSQAFTWNEEGEPVETSIQLCSPGLFLGDRERIISEDDEQFEFRLECHSGEKRPVFPLVNHVN